MASYNSQSFFIQHHPIEGYEDAVKKRYLQGLSFFLQRFCKDDPKVKNVFMAWGLSILGEDKCCVKWITSLPIMGKAFLAEVSEDVCIEAIKWPIRIHRKGFSLFSLRVPFLFDCFYLLEKSGKINNNNFVKSRDIDYLRDTYSFLHDKVCGLFSKGDLKYIYEFFLSSSGTDPEHRIPTQLESHRKSDLLFYNRKLKRVLIVASTNAGKSTLINAIVGKKINSVSAMACTNREREIFNKLSDEPVVLASENEVILTGDEKVCRDEKYNKIYLRFDSDLKNENICLIDSPGANNSRDENHQKITHKLIKDNKYDILVFVSDATNNMSCDEKSLLDFVIKESRKKIIVCLNKCDCFDPDDDSIQNVVSQLKHDLQSCKKSKIDIIPISAEAAYIFKKNNSHLKLSPRETFLLKEYSSIFSKPYYSLEKYGTSHQGPSRGLIGHTGINSIEYIIKSYSI